MATVAGVEKVKFQYQLWCHGNIEFDLRISLQFSMTIAFIKYWYGLRSMIYVCSVELANDFKYCVKINFGENIQMQQIRKC